MTLTVWGVLVRHFADCPSVRICLMFLLMIGLGLWVLERKTTEINHQATLIFYPHIVTSLSQDGCCCHSRIRITSKDGRKQKEGEKSQICPPLFFFFFLMRKVIPSPRQAQKAGDRMFSLDLDLDWDWAHCHGSELRVSSAWKDVRQSRAGKQRTVSVPST